MKDKDRHSSAYKEAQSLEQKEFRHVSPGTMALILAGRLRARRTEARKGLEGLKTPKPHAHIEGAMLSVSPKLLLALEAQVKDCERAVELMEELQAVLSTGYWRTI